MSFRSRSTEKEPAWFPSWPSLFLLCASTAFDPPKASQEPLHGGIRLSADMAYAFLYGGVGAELHVVSIPDLGVSRLQTELSSSVFGNGPKARLPVRL